MLCALLAPLPCALISPLTCALHAPLLCALLAPLLAATLATSPPAAFVVLACACDRADHARYTRAQLHRYAQRLGRKLPQVDIEFSAIDESCGGEWAQKAGAGSRAVVVVGSPGARACRALRAVAPEPRAVLAPACNAAHAQAAALVRVAAELGWNRLSLLSLTAPWDPESFGWALCSHAARGLARSGRSAWHAAVPAAGSGAARAISALLQPLTTRPPHAVIVCTSSGRWEDAGDVLRALDELAYRSYVVLLPAAPVRSTDSARSDTGERIVLDVMTSPYNNNLRRGNTFYTMLASSRSIKSQSSSYRSTEIEINKNGLSYINNGSHNDKGNDSTAFAHSSENNEVDEGLVRATNKSVSDVPKAVNNVGNETSAPAPLPRDLAPYLLLLGPVPPSEGPDDVFRGLLGALDHYGERLSHDPSANTLSYVLYERTPVASWRAVMTVNSTPSALLLDLEYSNNEILTTITKIIPNLEKWISERATAADRCREGCSSPRGPALYVAVVAGGVLVFFCLLVIALRYLFLRKGFSKNRNDAVLSVSDFTFPLSPDDDRRVGEGMETMLSCWLQQLHEYGGPELERPDLLQQPPAPLATLAPLVPSAPSSTCSVDRAVSDQRTRYKGDVVQMKYIHIGGAPELKRKAIDVVLVMQSLRHENLNPFLGCVCAHRPALVFEHCSRGSLEDVLRADDIKLDWTFRLSLLTDLVKGMRYLHGSPLRVHGRLTSRNCAVDARWVLRLTDYGLPSVYRAQGATPPTRTARELLWTAPELLREGGTRGSQPGDVFSFAVVMQEVILRGEPYCMLSLTPEEILDKLVRPPPLIRPSVSMSAAPPEAVSVMRQCWSEQPDLRPDFHHLYDLFRHLHRGRKINIIDSMFEMLEKYSNNLEELIKERTEQLDMEKKKTEQLLNRMLPSSVAERLLLGSRVEPEEFEEVTVYFSDIVGFTELAARSSPVQVVDLLNDLYTRFDAAIQQYRVYKVETIGDAYMVVGGLPERARGHAQQVATMALHLLHEAGRFRIRHLPATPLHLRSGVHTGPCCAAVVGLTMPRYCLFGDTVNTAARMEQTGAAWRVQLSASTAARLLEAGGYRLRSRGLTPVKGKGAMHTYWLLGKDGFDRPLPVPPPLPPEEVLFEADDDTEPSDCDEFSHEILQNRRASANICIGPSETLRFTPPPPGDRSPPLRVSSPPRRVPSPPRRVPSPPRRVPSPPVTVTVDHSAPYSRYRCSASASRVLYRQWSLERAECGGGEGGAGGARGRLPKQHSAGAALPSAAPTVPSPPLPRAPLALTAPPPAPPATRYRTRRADTDIP